jgi:transposase
VESDPREKLTVPVLAGGQNRDRPTSGPICATIAHLPGSDPPTAMFFYSPDRGGQHPEQHLAGYAGPMQADA